MKIPSSKFKGGNIILFLPLPSRDVSPNAKRGQSKAAAIAKAQKIKVHRTVAKFTCKDALTRLGHEIDAKGYSCRFYFEQASHTRDDDNADGSLKSYRDGICDALRINDKKLPKLLLSTFGIDAENPRVEVVIHSTIPVPPEAQELAEKCEAYEQGILNFKTAYERGGGPLMAPPKELTQLFNLLPDNDTQTKNQ